MRIGVDIRSLSEPHPGGVSVYAREVLRAMLTIDQRNEYVLFSNSWSRQPLQLFDHPRLTQIRTRIPNKFFHLGQLVGLPKIDRLTGPLDAFFLPNVNFISLSATCPMVMTVHDLSYEIYPWLLSFKRRWWHRVVDPRRLVRRADAVIAVSESTRRDLIDMYGIADQKVTTIHSGIDHVPEHLPMGTTVKPNPGIVTLSFLEPRKNVLTLLQAMKLVLRQRPEARLTIAGQPAWDMPMLRQTIRAERLESAVSLLGYISDDEKYQLLSAAQVFVYPSVYEGFGFPPLESLVLGTPVIATHAPSLPEVLQTRATLVNPYNAAELAVAMIEAIDQPRRVDESVRQSLRREYRWNNTALATLSVIESLAT